VGRKVREVALDTLNARIKLKSRSKPYFRMLDQGAHFGYRKGQRVARWLVRVQGGGDYTVETFSTADQLIDGKWKEVTDYYTAQDEARELAKRMSGNGAGSAVTGPFTVNCAMEEYLARKEAEDSKGLTDAKNRTENLIRPTLGDILVRDLTRDGLTKWINGIARRPRHVRGKAGKKSRALPAPATEEEKRQRKSSANRTRTVLFAALNQAFHDGRVDSDAAWRAVKPFREADSAKVRYFSVDEFRRLDNVTEGDFRQLLKAGVLTGCRYGELTRLRVGDFNLDAGTLFVGKSKSGKARHVVLTAEGQGFFRQLTVGRQPSELMLKRDGGGAWGPSHQIRPMKQACARARITPAAGFHILRHTYASLLVMAGAPLNVVATNLGHADTRMCERHYAHLAPSYVAETIRKFAPTFGTVEESNVVEATRRGGVR
jgi:integrase